MHFSDGYSWIDSAFLLLSTIAVCIWASIVIIHLTEFEGLKLNDLNDVSKNEIFFTIAFKKD